MSIECPPLEEFLVAPLEDVRAVAPKTVVFATGGTRRAAVLGGIDLASEQYMQLTRPRMIEAVECIFEHGAQHVFVPVLVDGNFFETTRGYREHLIRWINEGLGGPDSLADYRRLGWQARLIGAELVPDLADTAALLERKTASRSDKCVWFTATPGSERAWDLLFEKVIAHSAYSYRAAIRAVYGQDIPVDDVLLLDFGKPQVYTSAVPPLLICTMHCYWRQTLGYDLDSRMLRTIIHDYAFQRRTWQQDKQQRTESAHRYRQIWQNDPPTLGVGTRLGPFWYPWNTEVNP